jgi:hypothetical protein
MRLAARCDYKAANAKLSQANAARNKSREEVTTISQVKRYIEAKVSDRPQGCG